MSISILKYRDARLDINPDQGLFRAYFWSKIYSKTKCVFISFIKFDYI